MQESKQWEFNNKNYLQEYSLKDFKSGLTNSKIALCIPQTHGLRYLKTMLYNLCGTLTTEDLKKLRKIKNRDVGNPYSIKWSGQEIDLDYIQTIWEINFLDKNLNLDCKKILEFGSGYGRTCHAIISNYVVQYTLVDLPPALKLAKKYLKRVLNQKQFKRLTFIEAGKKMPKVDLVINIDSVGEMEEKTVQYYLDYIKEDSDYFYTKNPVGKYYDKSLDNHADGKKIVGIALNMGIIKGRVDLFDNKDVLRQSKNYIKAYKPFGWEVIDSSPAPFWSHYWDCLYER